MNRRLSLCTAVGLPTWLGGCDPTDPNEGDPEPGGGPTQTRQDILTTDLALNLTTLTERATVKARPSSATGSVCLDVSELTLSSVTVDGKNVDASKEDGLLPVTGANPELTIVIDYTFPARPAWAFDGWMPALGMTFVWPYYCANLFPCDPSMRDGVVFAMDLTGVEGGSPPSTPGRPPRTARPTWRPSPWATTSSSRWAPHALASRSRFGTWRTTAGTKPPGEAHSDEVTRS